MPLRYTHITTTEEDLSQPPDSVTIPAGRPSAAFEIGAREDDIRESDESLTVGLDVGELLSLVGLGEPSSIELTIRDKAPPAPAPTPGFDGNLEILAVEGESISIDLQPGGGDPDVFESRVPLTYESSFSSYSTLDVFEEDEGRKLTLVATGIADQDVVEVLITATDEWGQSSSVTYKVEMVPAPLWWSQGWRRSALEDFSEPVE